MRDQVFAHFVVGCAHQLHEVLGHASFVELLNQCGRNGTSFWCGFENCGTPSRNCTDQTVHGNCSGEVPRTGNKNKSVGSPGETPRNEFLVRNGGVSRVGGEVNGFGDFRVTLADSFAHGFRHDHECFMALLLHDFSNLSKNNAASGKGHALPLPLGSVRAFNSSVNLREGFHQWRLRNAHRCKSGFNPLAVRGKSEIGVNTGNVGAVYGVSDYLLASVLGAA